MKGDVGMKKKEKRRCIIQSNPHIFVVLDNHALFVINAQGKKTQKPLDMQMLKETKISLVPSLH